MAGSDSNSFVDKPVTGFTWKQGAWAIVTALTIEATLIGGFSTIKSDLARTKDDEAFDRTQIALQRVDIDVLKLQVTRLQAQEESRTALENEKLNQNR